ncbi:hypothetical protein ACG02S_03140 [Roseateles sp. DC23W]|uniref:DUF2946 domain-containing protein n=1 Tax=Pelomonas dachongensis TaxID=3299029 RepID=A0ABW7EHF8_9BURK
MLRPWLLMLLLACSLLGRPLHESWHIAHGEGDSAWAASAAAEHGSEDGNGNGEGDQQQPGDGCAWCLFHLQATLPGATPMPGLAKGEGVERHAALRYGLPVGHCTSAAEARGPPRG